MKEMRERVVVVWNKKHQPPNGPEMAKLNLGVERP